MSVQAQVVDLCGLQADLGVAVLSINHDFRLVRQISHLAGRSIAAVRTARRQISRK